MTQSASLCRGLARTQRGSGHYGSVRWTPQLALGDSLKLLYTGSYAAGVWTPEVGTSTLYQSSSTLRPTLQTAPADLLFDGTNDVINSTGNNASGRLSELNALPVAGTQHRLSFCSFKNTTGGASAIHSLWRGYSEVWCIDTDNKLKFITSGTWAVGNSALVSGTRYRAVVLCSDSTDVVKQYINNVLQTTNGVSSVFGTPTEWGSTGFNVGNSGGSHIWKGNIGCLGFACKSTAFTQDELDHLDLALQNFANS